MNRPAPRAWMLVMAVLSLGAILGLSAVELYGRQPPSSHEVEWLGLHGKEAYVGLEKCRECHDEFGCRACHLAEWPHPAGWQAVHGTTATDTKERGCMLCHDSGYCDPCHGGVTMPHPVGFTRSHFRQSATQDTCSICHADSDCQPCHQSHASHRSGGMVLQ